MLLLSHFNYCPLVWMFCSKKAHNLINSTHCRAMCAKLNLPTGNLVELLEMTNSRSIHTNNLQLMMIEVFKTLNRLSPEIMWNSFEVKPNSYNLRHGSSFVVPHAASTRAVNSFDFRASLAWNHLPAAIKLVISIPAFKSAIRNLSIYCRCKYCQ